MQTGGGLLGGGGVVFFCGWLGFVFHFCLVWEFCLLSFFFFPPVLFCPVYFCSYPCFFPSNAVFREALALGLVCAGGAVRAGPRTGPGQAASARRCSWTSRGSGEVPFLSAVASIILASSRKTNKQTSFSTDPLSVFTRLRGLRFHLCLKTGLCLCRDVSGDRCQTA